MKQEDLVVEKDYYIVRTGEFCNYVRLVGNNEFVEGKYRFVGQINIGNSSCTSGLRNIFYNNGYLMMACGSLDYIQDERITLLKRFMEENNITAEEIKKLL